MIEKKGTTIAIAHRLSTVRAAEKIVVLSRGAVMEEGTHDSLLEIGPAGHYYQLVDAQNASRKAARRAQQQQGAAMPAAVALPPPVAPSC